MRSLEHACRVLLLAAAIACAASPAAAQTLYWIDTNHAAPSIHRVDVNGVELASLALPAGSLPEGLAVDGAGRAYWGEAAWTDAKLMTAGSSLAAPAIVLGGDSVIRGVAVDATARQIYWTTSNLGTGAKLRRAPTAGGSAVTLLELGVGANPRGIAVDPVGGHLFWADFDRDIVYRSNLDGGALTPLVSLAPGSGPYGVAFDPGQQRVFWTEYNTGLIRYASTGGLGITTQTSGLAQPTYIALDSGSLLYYVIESGIGQQRIRAGTMYNFNPPITLSPVVTTFGGLAIASSATVGVPGPALALPTEFALEHPRPNPVSGSVRFRFALPREARFRLGVYDVRGREVATLAAGTLPGGLHEAWWNPQASSEAMPGGIYFARLVADGRAWTRRVVFVP